jgi:hypothetical protein
MNYRLATILAEESATTPATKTIDLNVNDPISRLNIIFIPLNSNQTIIGHPALCLKKVEIVDGSDVIFAADGKELRAAAFYGSGRPPVDILSYNTSDKCKFEASIYFGRKLYDPELALDPTKFTNLQLKITHDLALGGATPTTATLAVLADIFDEKMISPRGFLMTKELYSYLPGVSAHQYIDFPRDYPYRLIMVGGDSHARQPSVRIEELKLSEDFDRKIPIQTTNIKSILRGISAMTPRIMDHIIALIQTSETNIPMTAGYEGFAVGGGYGGSKVSVGFGNGGGGNIHGYGESAVAYWVHAGGWCPHNFVLLPTGDIEDIEDFYDPTGLKNLRLDILAGSDPGTSDAIQILGQQLRKY